MDKQHRVWQFIHDNLSRQVPVTLLYVLQSSGSSPGRQGFFMAVNAAGEMTGSIGGGIMERKFVQTAKGQLGVGSQEVGVLRKQVHDKSAVKDQSGMICSGEQTIFIYPVQSKDLGPIQSLLASLSKHRNGTLTLSPDGIDFDEISLLKNFEFVFESEEKWLFREKTGHKNQLTIIGGGHCSLALSNLASTMDFYIQVYEERSGLNTLENNSSAHEKHYIGSYTELKELVTPGDNHYVVVMTVGYRTDDTAIRALMNKQFKYLGLLGSATKVQQLLDEYQKEGIPEDRLQRIHTPIGLVIRSQTPEEIAVSIMAEIIRLKNAYG